LTYSLTSRITPSKRDIKWRGSPRELSLSLSLSLSVVLALALALVLVAYRRVVLVRLLSEWFRMSHTSATSDKGVFRV